MTAVTFLLWYIWTVELLKQFSLNRDKHNFCLQEANPMQSWQKLSMLLLYRTGFYNCSLWDFNHVLTHKLLLSCNYKAKYPCIQTAWMQIILIFMTINTKQAILHPLFQNILQQLQPFMSPHGWSKWPHIHFLVQSNKFCILSTYFFKWNVSNLIFKSPSLTICG